MNQCYCAEGSLVRYVMRVVKHCHVGTINDLFPRLPDSQAEINICRTIKKPFIKEADFIRQFLVKKPAGGNRSIHLFYIREREIAVKIAIPCFSLQYYSGDFQKL